MTRFVISVLALFTLPLPALAGPVSVKLTTNALGLGASDLNEDGTVDPDIAGKFWTSPTTGVGSILKVQQSGLAGSGSALDPLLVTITAETHLDVFTFPVGFPAVNDYHAGAIYLSNESTATPDGRDEGLGIRAFAVTAATGLRQIDANGRAKIEGSKDVSGGTDAALYDASNPNGAPHVDERALFTFDPASPVLANSLPVTLSKFESSDRIDLTVNLVGGAAYSTLFLGPPHPALTNPGDSVWYLNFGMLGAFAANDLVRSFSIRAVDDDPSHPSGTAEHFLITGFSADVVPEPGTLALLSLGVLTRASRRRRGRNRPSDSAT